MPRAKKASTKTKAIDVKSKKRHVNQSKKTRDEGAELHQTFTNSLSQLSAYWKKQLANTKKQMATTRAELKKAQDKLKTLKPTKVSSTAKKTQQREKAQLSFEMAKENLVQAKRLQETAKLEAKKYAQLNKSLKEIERDSRKQLAEAAAQAKQDAKKAKTKAKSAKPAKAKKADAEKAAPKAAKAKSVKAKAPKKTAKAAAEQPKKRGRKAKTNPIKANLAVGDQAEADMNDIFEEQTDFSDMIHNEENVHIDFEDGSEDAFEEVTEIDDEVLDH